MWECTDLVVRTVFKIAEAAVRRLVGSIPTRSRQKRAFKRGTRPQERITPCELRWKSPACRTLRGYREYRSAAADTAQKGRAVQPILHVE